MQISDVIWLTINFKQLLKVVNLVVGGYFIYSFYIVCVCVCVYSVLKKEETVFLRTCNVTVQKCLLYNLKCFY